MHFFLEWILENSFYINIILAIIIVFFQRKDPSSVWAWLLLLYFIPILGFILYLIIGYDYRKEKRFRSKEIEDQLNAAIEIQESRIRNRKIKISEGYEAYDDLVLYNLKTNDAIYTNHNQITIFTDGTALFEDIVNEILGAKKYIHIQSYIIRDGQLLKHLLPILKQKVKEGVSVRLFFDGIGGRAIRKQTLRTLSDAGISVGVFFPALFGKLHLRMNYRKDVMALFTSSIWKMLRWKALQ
jgi:cardiolipin synthase